MRVRRELQEEVIESKGDVEKNQTGAHPERGGEDKASNLPRTHA